MKPARASGEWMAIIADIENHRQKMEKIAGIGASCDAALRKLHEILGREQKALQARGSAAHADGAKAITAEIARIKALRGPAAGYASASQGKATWRDAQQGPARSRGRRTMGRAGDR